MRAKVSASRASLSLYREVTGGLTTQGEPAARRPGISGVLDAALPRGTAAFSCPGTQLPHRRNEGTDFLVAEEDSQARRASMASSRSGGAKVQTEAGRLALSHSAIPLSVWENRSHEILIGNTYRCFCN